MFVLATAGHVDHGKSSLVRALTHINPDRLREEQVRGMTLDLGFAWMTLPGPTQVDPISLGIIDVPGHIDFIDNMLAGVGGIDAALVVIAADEGPMPQTREHLNILQLLRVPRAVVALTKADLVDEDWLEVVGDDVRRVLAPTPLAGAPIVPVSAKSGAGLPTLTQALAGVLADVPTRADLGKPRLSVDRAFSMPGFGTIVTGTLIDGSFGLGDEVEVLTQTGEVLPARVRGLQTHKQKLERAEPGSRVAMNLAGVEVGQLARGSVVARPGLLRPTTLLDVYIELLADAGPAHAGAGLRHTAEVKIFSGAAQSMAKVWLLEGNGLAASGSGWAQLLLTSPLAPANGDRFIVRLPSPSMTLGGGVIVDAHPALRYRRRGGHAQADVLARLEALSKGTPAERLIHALNTHRFATAGELAALAQLNALETLAARDELLANGTVLVSQDVLGLAKVWQAVSVTATDVLARFHQAQPLLEGMPRDTLRSQLKLDSRAFNALLDMAGQPDTPAQVALHDAGETVRLRSHQVQLNPAQQRAVDALLAQCQASPWATPSVKECKALVGERVYGVLLRQRRLVQCGAEVVLLPDSYDTAVQRIREMIARDGQTTAAQVRDAFNTSRKYALGLLEHLDEIGVTQRVTDARVLRQ